MKLKYLQAVLKTLQALKMKSKNYSTLKIPVGLETIKMATAVIQDYIHCYADFTSYHTLYDSAVQRLRNDTEKKWGKLFQ